MIAVAPDGDGKRVSVIGLFGETIIRTPLPIAEKPLRGDLVLHPCGGDLGSRIQGMRPCVPHNLQAVELTYCRHHVGGIRALGPTRFEETPIDKQGEHLGQEVLFRPTRDQPGPKLAQDRKIEASIGEFQPSGLLPINASPYGISGLSIGQVLRKLQDGDEGQAPGRFGWLSDVGIQAGQLVMALKRPQCIAHLPIPIPTGKGCARDFGGVFRYIQGWFRH
jgi:hypothetical protein